LNNWAVKERDLVSHSSTFSDIDNLLLSEQGNDGNEALLGSFFEDLLDVVVNILQVFLFWKVDIRLDLTVGVEELKSGVVNVEEGEFLSDDDWCVDHITCVEGALVDLGGKDIFTLEDDLGGSVLSWLCGGGFSDFAWVSLDHNKGAWLKSVGISLLAHGGTGIGDFKSFILVRHLSLSLLSINIIFNKNEHTNLNL